MYRKILVPLDGSELAERALDYAKEPAAKLGAKVILVHVCSPEECHCEAAKCSVQPMHRVYVEHTAYMFMDALEAVGTRNAEIGWEALIGDPATEIIRYSKENDVSLIIMATHGRSGISRWAMGSVTDKVIRGSDVPVWLVRAFPPKKNAHSDWPESKMLVLLDGSNMAEQVLPYVAQHAEMSSGELILLRVCDPPIMPAYYSPSTRIEIPSGAVSIMPEDYLRLEKAALKQLAEQYLAKVEKQLKKLGLAVSSVVLDGQDEVAKQIIDYANLNPFNLIAMSTHGRSGLARWAFGSVADKVLHATSSPILLVRPH